MTRLAVAMGGQPQTLAGLAGLGDLVLTCTGELSRNRTVGVELARGRKLDEIVGSMKMVREVLAATLADEEASVRLVHEHLIKRLAELDTKEENLLDLVEDGGAIAAKVRTRLVAIGEERARVKAELTAQGPLLEAGAALITAALELLDNPQELYRQTTDPVRRQLNQVFYDKLFLDTAEVTDDRLAKPFDDFLYRRSSTGGEPFIRDHIGYQPKTAPQGTPLEE